MSTGALAGSSPEMLLLAHRIPAIQKQSLAHGITPVLSPSFPDNPAQALRSTGGILDLPTDGRNLSFGHLSLVDDITQSASIHLLHHQPELLIHKVAERRKQGRGDQHTWLCCCLKKKRLHSCFQLTLRKKQNKRNQHSLSAVQYLQSVQSQGEWHNCKKGDVLDG